MMCGPGIFALWYRRSCEYYASATAPRGCAIGARYPNFGVERGVRRRFSVPAALRAACPHFWERYAGNGCVRSWSLMTPESPAKKAAAMSKVSMYRF
jgi:hypothetical protein